MIKKKMLLIYICLVFLLVVLLGFNILKKPKKMILSVKIPNSPMIVELWERSIGNFVFGGDEYETYMVIVNPQYKKSWFTIDEQYITFREVYIFYSKSQNTILVETNGSKTHLHKIAEYNISSKTFKAESKESIRGKDDWIILKKIKVR